MILLQNSDRRGFMVQALAGPAATMLVAAPTHASASSAGFGALQPVRTSLLDIAYAEVGPADGTPVLLVHGWPYDIHTYADVAQILGAQGYRVLVPYLRGYGATRFLSDTTSRNGQQAALAVDALDFLDALGIGRAVIGGCDWAHGRRAWSPRSIPNASARWSRSAAI